MVSGTPLLTTKLPGMPEEYYPFVYLINEESVEGFSKAMLNVLNQSDEMRRNKGLLARTFVLNEKNNVIQAKRILQFMCNDKY